MNLFKKSTAAVALVTLVSSVFTTGVSAYSTSEIEAANTLAQAGIIVDQSGNTAAYNLDQNVLRQEIAAVARGIAGLPKDTVYSNVFSDVTETTPNTWAWASVNPLATSGLIAKNAQFRPEANISKAEAVGMVVKAAFGDAYAYDASLSTSWQEQVVAFAVANGVVSSFTNYDTAATRGFVFEAGANAMSSNEDEEMDDIICTLLGTCGTEEDDNTNEEDDNTTVTTPVVTGGNVEVSLSPMSPASSNLPKLANGVSVAKFDLSAGNQDVSISSVQLKRVGLGASAAVREVALFSNDSRISKIRTFGSSDDLVDIALSPALVLKAGSTETITVKVNTENATGLFAIQLSSLTSSANVLGGVQTGSQHEVKDVSTSTVEVSNDGTVSKPKLGETQAEVKRFKIRNASTTNEDVVVSEITFKEDGTIKETTELANVSLYYGSTKLATVASMKDKYVTFKFAPMTIKDGKTERFTIKADIIGGADTNIDFVVENKLDLTATASKVGFVSTDITGLTSQVVAVDAGEVSLLVEEPATTKIREDKKDITLGGFNLVSKGAVELSRIKFSVQTTNATNVNDVFELNSFKLYDLTNGTKYDLTAVANGNNIDLSENDLSIIINSSAKFAVKADTKTSITNFDNYKFRLSLTTAANGLVLKEIVDDKVVTDITPSTLTWKSIEGVEAGLAINVLNQSNRISVVGAKAVDVMAFEVESTNESSDLTVREITVAGTVVDKASNRDTVLAALNAIPTATSDNAAAVNASVAAAIAALEAGNVRAPLVNADANGNTVLVNAAIALVPADVNNGTDTQASNTRINAVYLYAGETLVAQKSGSQFSAGSVTFNGFEVAVPKNSKKLFYVKADFLDDANMANDTVRFSVTDYQVEDDERTDVYASGDTNVAIAAKQSSRTTTLKGFGSITLAADAGNDDNKNKKSILAGESAVVYSADVQSINENVKVEEVVFTLDSDVSKINNASLYLGNTLIATNSSSDITATTITFKNLNNLIITDSSEELKLQLNTATIGYEKIGATVVDVLVTQVELKEATGVSSNKDVPDVTLATTLAKEFSIVPVKVVASVVQTLSNGTAKVKFSVVRGGNSVETSNSTSNIVLQSVALTNLTANTDYSIYREGNSGGAAATFGGLILEDRTISNEETYVLVPQTTTQGITYTLQLAKESVVYRTSSATDAANNGTVDLNINLANDLDLGTKTY